MTTELAPSCRAVIAELADYLDGELPFAARATLEAHFVSCYRCVTYLAGYRETVRLLRRSAALRDGVGPALPDELVAMMLAPSRA